MSAVSVAAEKDFEQSGTFLPAHASRLVEAAVLFCTAKTQFRTEEQVARALAGADSRVHDLFRHYLALQVAEYLRKLDANLTGIYSYSYGDSEEEGLDRRCSPTAPLTLILRVRRKTAALRVAVEALDAAILEEYTKLIAPAGHKMTSLLDVQMVDDEEAEQRTGLAVVLTSAHIPPIRVWPA